MSRCGGEADGDQGCDQYDSRSEVLGGHRPLFVVATIMTSNSKTLPPLRAGLTAALAALALALAFCSAPLRVAAAAPSTRKLIWGPYDAKAFDTYEELGAGLYEITINWSRIAPTRPAEPTDPNDPAYTWTPAVEEAIANAREHGIQVVLEVTGAPALGQWRAIVALGAKEPEGLCGICRRRLQALARGPLLADLGGALAARKLHAAGK